MIIKQHTIDMIRKVLLDNLYNIKIGFFLYTSQIGKSLLLYLLLSAM